MPLLDHFHPPLAPLRHWEGFHSRWASALADALNPQLPDRYFAEPQTSSGMRVEVDVATFESVSSPASPSPRNGNVATLPAAPAWVPPAAVLAMPCVVPATFAVRVFHDDGGARLVGAIELASPGNKDRPEERRAYAVKCANYLYQGISAVVIDIVTNRHANLHNEIVRVMENEVRFLLDPVPRLYAVAYRPVRRGEQEEALFWPYPLSLGQTLPTVPLFLGEELCLPVDLEATYAETCQRLKLV